MINLYPHQKDALEKIKDKNKVAIYYDMGLGQTFIGSEKLKELNNPINLVIVQKSKVDDWVEHFKEHYPLYIIYDLTNKKQYEEFISRKWNSWVIGVINYDLVWRRSELLNLKDMTIMLDESSLIQNESSKRTKFIMKLAATNIILLSGTPCSGKYENLYSQYSPF